MIPKRLHIILPMLFGIFFFFLDYILSHFGPTPFTFRVVLWSLIQSAAIYATMYWVLIRGKQSSSGSLYFKIPRIILAVVLAAAAVMAAYLLFRMLYPSDQYSLATLKWSAIWILLILTFFESLLILFVLQTIVYFQEKTRLKIREEQLRQETVKAQFELLKNEINPHFLFNNFNTLYGLIQEDPKIASEYLLNFSQLFRYLMVTRGQDTETLGEEVKMVKSFEYVLLKRYQEQFSITWNIPEDLYGHRIVPLALQMLIENAVKHNQIDQDHALHLSIGVQEKRIVVSNRCAPKKYPEDASGQGLKNLVNRYQFLTDEKVIIRNEDGQFEVSIPLITHQHENTDN